MARRWLETELRKTGDVFDELLADQIADRRELRGDIPFPEKELPVTQRFTEKAREALENKGMLIYELTGQSILTLKNKGYPFFSSWHSGHDELEEMTSVFSEVAIDPNGLFIPESNKKTFKQQLELVKQHKVSLQVPDSAFVIGQAPDYVELAFLHLDSTGERLFGEKYNHLYTATQTVIDGKRINVGHFVQDEGIVVNNLMSDRDRREQVFVSSVIVPA